MSPRSLQAPREIPLGLTANGFYFDIRQTPFAFHDAWEPPDVARWGAPLRGHPPARLRLRSGVYTGVVTAGEDPIDAVDVAFSDSARKKWDSNFSKSYSVKFELRVVGPSPG